MCFVISYIHTRPYFIVLVSFIVRPLCFKIAAIANCFREEQKNQSQVLQQKDKKDSEKWSICGQTIYPVVFLIGMF